ncbi:hypothetical protein FQN50_002805 [Emmonsiellopsis sp. PD_5]|nr:hypothetical protein FQN50_002805 [Emmonsiellopsis sp. PD_5]
MGVATSTLRAARITIRQPTVSSRRLQAPFFPTRVRVSLKRQNSNGAVTKVGEIESIEILYMLKRIRLRFSTDEGSCRHRNDGTSPVHKSRYNPNDKELIVSARIKPLIGSAKTHHIYANGTGTMKVGDKKEYSTSATQSS